jgi:phosphonoacetaldehyde hydrolase
MSRETPRLRLAVLDWAGTTVDHGCFAPVAPFVETMRRLGIELSVAQARGPMGLLKLDHLRKLFELESVSAQFRARQGREWTEDDVRTAYDQHFIPLQLGCVQQCSRLVPGLLPAVAALRERGLKIGTTTGYFRDAAELTYAAAAEQGYRPDCNFNPGDVPTARPAPWMVFRAMEATGVYPPCCVVKVGDTLPDIEEGLAAGAWSVGVIATGSDVGLSEAEWNALSTAERQRQLEAVGRKLREAGAHFAIPSIADLPALVTEIDRRLAAGQRP